MLNIKKSVAILSTTLLLMQGIPGIPLQHERAKAATMRPAMQEIMSRPYPRVIGNQYMDKNLSSSKIQRIAKILDMVSINKSGDLFAENGANVSIANQLRAVNPKIKVLQYVNLIDIWNYQKGFTWIKNNAPLKDDNGRIIYPYESTYGQKRIAADPTKTIWQDYYANHCKNIVNQGMDGIFSDNWFRSNSQGWKVSSSRFSSIQKGWEQVGQKAKNAIGSNKILIGNSPAYGLYQSRDAAMIEMRNQPNSKAFNEYLKMSDEAASYGQANLDTIHWDWSGKSFMTNYDSVLSFSLPSCLLTDNIFGIADNDGLYSIIEKVGKIGYPKGARYRADNILQRDFDQAKVLFNDTSGSRTINLPAGVYKNLDGKQVNSVTLSSFRGIILRKSGTETPPTTPPTDTTQIPAAPSNLTMSSVTKGATSGNYYVNLSWKDNSNNEARFEIQQSKDGTNFQTIKTPAANTNNYGVNVGTSTGTYYFKIIAVNSAGKSQASNTVTAKVGTSGETTPPAPQVPAAPSDLAVKVTKGATSGTYYANLTWKDNSSDETAFEILQSVNSTDNFKVVKTGAANSTTYGVNIGTNPTPGTHYFKVVAVSNNGKSQPSNVVSINIGNPGPAAPSNLTVTSVTKGATSGNYYVNLSWKDNSNNETGFELLQSTDGTNFQIIKTPAANTDNYGVNIGSSPTKGTYYFKIIAVNGSGKSQPSNTASTPIK